jgi:hypothetical protein
MKYDSDQKVKVKKVDWLIPFQKADIETKEVIICFGYYDSNHNEIYFVDSLDKKKYGVVRGEDIE